VERILDIGYY